MDLLTIFLCLQSFGSSLAQQKSSSRKRGPRSSSGRSTGGSKLLLDAASSLPIEDGYWEVQKTAHAAFDSIRDDKLYIKKADIDNTGIHSCYFYKLLSNTRLGLEEETGSFCYPAIMVTGMRKCSTSALYALLASLPGAVGNDIKENCPFVGTRSIIEYFKSLPKYVEAGEVIVDGCVDLNSNLLMKDILREPNTFYIVSTLPSTVLPPLCCYALHICIANMFSYERIAASNSPLPLHTGYRCRFSRAISATGCGRLTTTGAAPATRKIATQAVVGFKQNITFVHRNSFTA
jgi:hypothetical protein